MRTPLLLLAVLALASCKSPEPEPAPCDTCESAVNRWHIHYAYLKLDARETGEIDSTDRAENNALLEAMFATCGDNLDNVWDREPQHSIREGLNNLPTYITRDSVARLAAQLPVCN
jgi:hypothetical protein